MGNPAFFLYPPAQFAWKDPERAFTTQPWQMRILSKALKQEHFCEDWYK